MSIGIVCQHSLYHLGGLPGAFFYVFVKAKIYRVNMLARRFFLRDYEIYDVSEKLENLAKHYRGRYQLLVSFQTHFEYFPMKISLQTKRLALFSILCSFCSFSPGSFLFFPLMVLASAIELEQLFKKKQGLFVSTSTFSIYK